MELLLDVLLEACPADAIDVAGRRPESDAVQHVDDGLVVRFRGHGGSSGLRQQGCGCDQGESGDGDRRAREASRCTHVMTSAVGRGRSWLYFTAGCSASWRVRPGTALNG